MQAQTHAPAACNDGRTSGAAGPWQRKATGAGKWAARPCEDERTQAAAVGRESQAREGAQRRYNQTEGKAGKT